MSNKLSDKSHNTFKNNGAKQWWKYTINQVIKDMYKSQSKDMSLYNVHEIRKYQKLYLKKTLSKKNINAYEQSFLAEFEDKTLLNKILL